MKECLIGKSGNKYKVYEIENGRKAIKKNSDLYQIEGCIAATRYQISTDKDGNLIYKGKRKISLPILEKIMHKAIIKNYNLVLSKISDNTSASAPVYLITERIIGVVGKEEISETSPLDELLKQNVGSSLENLMDADSENHAEEK
ncbi:hypothetical protein HYV50_00430 [Candidatus Pacearchaeota archaeon]|nr:hypothetical protein [Candidatus Pacearchaeota archaeon]